MMSDHDGREKLNTYLDGALTDLEKETVERHIQGCNACREQLKKLRDVRAAVRALPRLRPGESFKGEVMERLLHDRNRLSPLDAIAAALQGFTLQLLRTPAFYGILLACVYLRMLGLPQPDEHGDFACLMKPAFVSAVTREGRAVAFQSELDPAAPESREINLREEIHYVVQKENLHDQCAVRLYRGTSCPGDSGNTFLEIHL